MNGWSRRVRPSRGPGSLYRRLLSLRYLATRDRAEVVRFLAARDVAGRAALVGRCVRATNHVRGYHTLAEMLVVMNAILERPGAVVVEAGCGYGGSTAKLSLAVRRAGGRLMVFDSFRGIPPNAERHELLDGREVVFRAGAFRGRLAGVQRAVERYGAAEVCTWHKGWLADTLPALPGAPGSIDVAVLDVDLADSTRTCLRELVPRLRPGGVLFSLDGQLRATHELMADARFWREEVGVPVPHIDGLHRDKLLTVRPTR
jgi:O-methyltransferase